MQHVFNTIAKINHHPFDCSFSNLRLTKETQPGFSSEFHFICEICQKKEIIGTKSSSDKIIPINLAILAWSVQSGLGYSSVEKLFACLNMPCTSNPTYQKLHEKVGKNIKSVAREATKEAALEETKLAIENGGCVQRRDTND